jgi:hypothetical protein
MSLVETLVDAGQPGRLDTISKVNVSEPWRTMGSAAAACVSHPRRQTDRIRPVLRKFRPIAVRDGFIAITRSFPVPRGIVAIKTRDVE